MTHPAIARFNVGDVFALEAFSHAVVAGGQIYLSGVLGTIGRSLELAPGGVRGETVQALRNIERVLAACGARLDHLLKVTVYMREVAMFLEMNAAYIEIVTCRPARTCVYGCSLPLGAALEIDAIALAPLRQDSAR